MQRTLKSIWSRRLVSQIQNDRTTLAPDRVASYSAIFTAPSLALRESVSLRDILPKGHSQTRSPSKQERGAEGGRPFTNACVMRTVEWSETDYSVYTMRQASRRSWRIGQTQPVQVVFMAYRNALQADALQLVAGG